MPSRTHKAVVGILRLARVTRRPVKLNLHAKPIVPPRWATRSLTVTRTEHAGWPVHTLTPQDATGRVVVGFHGGGYVLPITPFHWWYYGDLARRTRATVVVPLYPLAPLGSAGEVIPAAADLLEGLISTHGAQSISVAGDSAGAGLSLAAIQELHARGKSVPARLLLLSPWLDVTVSDPASADVSDPMLDITGLRAGGRMWAGNLALEHPHVSPLFGSLDGLPPMLVTGGTLDLLQPDQRRLLERAADAGIEVESVLEEGLMHGWAGQPFLPEAKAIRDRVHAFLVPPGQA